MNNCHDCTHKKSSLNVKRTCSLGHDELLNAFYERNGSKLVQDITETTPCYEPSEASKRLDSLLGKTNDLLKAVRNAG